MNFKFKHIKNRFQLQILFFIVFGLFFTGIFWIYNRSVRRYDTTIHQLSLLRKEIQAVHALSGQILNECDVKRENENNASLSELSILENIEDSLNSFFEIGYIKKVFKGNHINDSIITALGNCRKSIQYVNLSKEELSALTRGNSNALTSISTDLLKTFSPPIDSELFAYAVELKSLETEFLFFANKRAYDDLMVLIGNLSYNPLIQETILPDNENLTSRIENYQAKAQHINTIFERMGYFHLNKGEFYELENYFSNFKNTYEDLEYLVHQKIRKRKTRGVFLFTLITLLLSAAYVSLIIFLMKKVKLPLSQSVKFSYDLSKGKLSITDLDKNAPYEYASLNQNLNTIYNAIREKRIFVDNLLKQKFDSELPLQGKGDTFGKTLLALRETMRKAREEQLKYSEENQRRRYLNEGIAKFANILRTNSSDLDKLSDIFIRELVKYLEAIQGGVFLTDENKKDELSLAASFAYNRKKYLEKSIKKGVGLIGTCAIEKKSINLSEIPEEYLEITSGLGDAPPTNLLLLPVMHENELIGVVELASLKKFDEHQVEVGENIASSLASTIINTKINARTSQLLAKSQQQAAEMAEQEEEMRQNMEELEATQEESARREEELEGFLNAINQSFYVLEYDTGGVIQSANEKLSNFLSLPSEKIIGKTHHELFGKGTKADNLLFASVSEGNTVELTEKIILNNKPIEINNTFSPLRSKTGTTIRILNIMTVNFK